MHYINTTLKLDILFLREIIYEPEKYHLYMPIAHIIKRTPEFSANLDACLTGAGGVSRNTNFWWFLPWLEDIIYMILKAFVIRLRVDADTFISINLLEYATILVSYASTLLAWSEKSLSSDQTYPIVRIEAYNITSVAWTKRPLLPRLKINHLLIFCLNHSK